MQIILQPAPRAWDELTVRNIPDDEGIALRVGEIVDEVRRRGDEALRDFARRFDGAELDGLIVSPEEFQQAAQAVSPEVKRAMEEAARNIRAFHAAQQPPVVEVETQAGVVCEQHPVPIQRVGLYVPGGRAPLFSTVLMLALPAKIAGCPEVVLCTPQGRGGEIAPEILYAAQLCGVDRVVRVGGAQAVAAMAYGTESVPRVDKIFGPGNRYVTKAKQLVQRTVAIDMPAGPSEVLVMADAAARPAYVAADMLSQAEHGPDSQAMLVCHSEAFAREVEAEVVRQAARLSRAESVEASLAHSRIVVLADEADRIAFANAYAAEHLILSVQDPRGVAARITAAGSIFLGNFSPESAGDYASGTNHTLPTGGHARAYSGVNLDSFLRKITWQELAPQGLHALAPTIMAMARAEGLDAHAAAVEVRLADCASAQPQPLAIDDVLRLVRPNIRALEPYSTARDEAKEGQIDTWLDANESPYENGVNRYPDPHQKQLKVSIAQLKGVRPEEVFVGGAGSDEAIDLVYRIFCEPGVDNVLSISPTYGVYRVAADVNHVALREVPLGPGFSLPTEALLRAADAHTKVLWVCSPNNPTGNAFDVAELERLAESFRGVVVIDEAYVDFSPKGSMLSVLDRHPNVVVLQTFSKAWGMAGLRLGMAFAHPEVAALFAKVKHPYNVNGPTQQRVAEAIRKGLLGEVEEICGQRAWLAEALKHVACVEQLFPTDANFFLFRTACADALYEYLVAHGVMVRNRSRVKGLEGCLRITIGTPEENRRVVRLLHSYNNMQSEAPACACGEAPEQPPCAETPQPLRRALFIDRDGTLIEEPEDEQIDSLEKLAFVPGVLTALPSIAQLDFELVMVSNQDGLGTDAFPEDTFHPAHNKMLHTLAGEGVRFDEQLIDRTFPHEHVPTRKPGTAMLTRYLQGDYDMAHSYVIGDRLTDVELAHNLGCKAIWLRGRLAELPAELAASVALVTDNWHEIAEFLRRTERRSEVVRRTRETQIRVQLDLDGGLESDIHTGLNFFDHMLWQLPHHGGLGLRLYCAGDTEVDEHHTMEDVALALGTALREALGEKRGIGRYGFELPMDECRAKVLLDLGGRASFQWHVPFTRDRVGDTPTEMFEHFFLSLSSALQCNLHIEAEGTNNHHLIEGVFKAFARALRQAVSRNVFSQELPSSKGVL